jgi:hypothetical protein
VFIQVNVVGFVIQKESTAETSFQTFAQNLRRYKVRKNLLSNKNKLVILSKAKNHTQ